VRKKAARPYGRGETGGVQKMIFSVHLAEKKGKRGEQKRTRRSARAAREAEKSRYQRGRASIE